MNDDDAIFSEIIKGAMPGKVVSNYILVCEVLTKNGVELSIATSESMTPWLGLGLLQSAENILQGAEDIYLFGDDSEDEDYE